MSAEIIFVDKNGILINEGDFVIEVGEFADPSLKYIVSYKEGYICGRYSIDGKNFVEKIPLSQELLESYELSKI